MQNLLTQMDKLSSLIKQEDHFRQQAKDAHSDFQAIKEQLLSAKRALENKRGQRVKEVAYKIKSIKEQLAIGNTEEANTLVVLNAEMEALNTGNFMAIDRNQLAAEVNDTVETFYRAIAAQELYHSWYFRVNVEKRELSHMLTTPEMVLAGSVVQNADSIISEIEPMVEIITGEPAKCNAKNYMKSWALTDTARSITAQGRERINQIKAELFQNENKKKTPYTSNGGSSQ